MTLLTTIVFGGGLYNAQDESYYSNQQRKHLVPSDHGENNAEDLVPLISNTPTSDPKYLVALSAVGFVGSYGEGAMVTWSVIYFQRYISVPRSLRAIGFFTFMLCMAVGRFSCDFLRKILGRRKLIRVAGIFAGVGIFLLILAPSLESQIFELLLGEVGVILTGLGLSTIVPTVFSSAGHLPGVHAGTSIATVAAFTYCGSIVAPIMIGGVSQGLHSLRYSFTFIGALVSLMFPLSFRVPTENQR